MAALSPSPNSSPPILVPPPLPATTQPPSSQSPTQSKPNVSADSPTPSNSSTPPNSSTPSNSFVPSTTPPQTPPLAPFPPPPSPPPPIPISPPPSSPPSSPPSVPPISSSPSISSPPPRTPSPPPISQPPPPISSSPPSNTPPPASRPTPPISSPPPPTPIDSPPPKSPPPSDSPLPPSLPVVPPLPPAISPSPSSITPPSPPPAGPPKNSPPPPSLPSPSPSGSNSAPPPSPTPKLVPPSPSRSPPPPPLSPPKNRTDPIPSPSNSSIPLTPPTTPPSSSPLRPGDLSPPNSPSLTDSSNPSTRFGNSTSSGRNGIKTGSVIVITLAVAFVVVGVIGAFVWFLRRRNKKVAGLYGGYNVPSPYGSSYKSDTPISKTPSAHLLGNGSSSSGFPYSPPEPGGLGNSRPWFAYEELLEITNGFSQHNLLGEGGFGPVYKGRLPDGTEVAVKQLKVGGSQGEREFKAEVDIISRIHHRHLVSLVGYCISEHQRLLVYDYVPNNTLYYHLHGEGRPVLDWAIRLKVAAGAARGIAYLHEDCHPRIIHRDIKSSNILVDNNFEARVSDFGLAKLALDSFTHVTTRVMGTFGYLAPEYASSGKLTDKSDVYSFGVVLLELITGRKPVDPSQPLGDESLVEWARPLLTHALENRDFEELVDSRLEKNYVESEMFRLIEAAAACVRHSSIKRPRMGQIVRALDFVDSTDLNNGMKPGQSKLFDSAQQSEEIRLFHRMAFGSQEYSTDFSEKGWRHSREF